MNKDEVARAHLATVLRMAVRLGRLSVPDHAMDAELRDLAQIYLDATGNPMAWDAVKLQGLPVESGGWYDTLDLRQAAPATEVAPECGFKLPMMDDPDHVHECDKALGHADGPGGSDHHCEWCGVLYDAAGGTASPLMRAAGVPLGANGPAEAQREME